MKYKASKIMKEIPGKMAKEKGGFCDWLLILHVSQ